MTLREMFWNVNQKSFTERMIANEKIADEFCIGFAEWLNIQYRDLNHTVAFYNKTLQELLEIYKKEKGL